MLIELEEIKNRLKGDYQSLILFGSYSRGDNKTDSDLDILQISNTKSESYSFGKVNISVYTFEQLVKMAKEGNLFVYHIVTEGKTLDGEDLIKKIKDCFIKPINYDQYKSELKLSAKLLDITLNEYNDNWSAYNNLLCYLFRSYLYAILFERDELVFSVKEISSKLEDDKILAVFELKKTKEKNYYKFLNGKILFELYSNTVFKNEYGTQDELLKSIETKSLLPTFLRKHFINVNAEVEGKYS